MNHSATTARLPLDKSRLSSSQLESIIAIREPGRNVAACTKETPIPLNSVEPLLPVNYSRPGTVLRWKIGSSEIQQQTSTCIPSPYLCLMEFQFPAWLLPTLLGQLLQSVTLKPRKHNTYWHYTCIMYYQNVRGFFRCDRNELTSKFLRDEGGFVPVKTKLIYAAYLCCWSKSSQASKSLRIYKLHIH